MSNIPNRLATALLFLFALRAGAQSIEDLKSTVRERTGQWVEWRKESAAEGQVSQAVHSLLQRALTADTTAQIALLNNRDLQATFEEIGIANADLIEAGLLKNPVFTGSARLPNQPPGAADVELSIAQEFLDLLMLPLRKRVARTELARTKLKVGDAVLKLSADAKAAFYTMQARQQLLARLDTVSETNAAAADLALKQYHAGNISDLDLANQQATFSQSKLDATEAAAEISGDREKLNRLMGLSDGETGWKIGGELRPVPAKECASEQRLESLAMAQRLDLAAAKSDLSGIVQDLGITRTYRYAGSVEFGVDSERQSDGQRITGPTFQLELPIFNFGQGRIARLQAQLRQAERRLEALAIDIRSEVRELRVRLDVKRSVAVQYQDEILPERKRILELTLTQYNGMLKGPYDLLTAKQSEVAAERGYLDALREYWITRAELDRAVGGISMAAETETKKPRKH